MSETSPNDTATVTDRKDSDGRQTRPDYANRKRNLEWRQTWFHLIRPRDDQRLLDVWRRGLDRKREMIERQRDGIGHLAGYGPAGAGSPWFTIGPRNVNGRVEALAAHPTDPNTLYAGAAGGGVWKSTDAGQSWRPLWDQQDTMASVALAIAPTRPTRFMRPPVNGPLAGGPASPAPDFSSAPRPGRAGRGAPASLHAASPRC